MPKPPPHFAVDLVDQKYVGKGHRRGTCFAVWPLFDHGREVRTFLSFKESARVVALFCRMNSDQDDEPPVAEFLVQPCESATAFSCWYRTRCRKNGESRLCLRSCRATTRPRWSATRPTRERRERLRFEVRRRSSNSLQSRSVSVSVRLAIE